MDKNEALLAARTFVAANYPIVPPVLEVTHILEQGRALDRKLLVEQWVRLPGETESHQVTEWSEPTTAALRKHIGKWLISFGMSWDTDVVHMPVSLTVIVDDSDPAAIKAKETWI